MKLGRIAILLVPLIAAAACESATNLDVAYAGPDGSAPDATADAVANDADRDADPDADAEAATPAAPLTVEGCPCDPTEGLGCCVTAKDAFCTNDHDTCSKEKGAFIRCSRRDPSTESECCWLGSGAGSTTRYTAGCDGGLTACLADADCTGTGMPCTTKDCAGFTIGQCATSAPACPSP